MNRRTLAALLRFTQPGQRGGSSYIVLLGDVTCTGLIVTFVV